jgi:hypothetical protein
VLRKGIALRKEESGLDEDRIPCTVQAAVHTYYLSVWRQMVIEGDDRNNHVA